MSLTKSRIICVLIVTVLHAPISSGFGLPSPSDLQGLFPLSFESPGHLIYLFLPSGHFHDPCSEARPDTDRAVQMAFVKCVQHIVSSGRDVESRMLSELPACLRQRLREIAKDCNLEPEDQQFLEQAFKNNKYISEKLADYNEEGKFDFRRGMQCLADADGLIKECAKNVTEPNMTYDEEGCSAFETYIECSFEFTQYCHEGFATFNKNLLQDVMTDSCQDNDVGHDGNRNETEPANGRNATNLQKETNSILRKILEELTEQTEILKQRDEED